MRKPVDGMATAIMIGLCLAWGFQQVVIKVAAQDVAPVLQLALRSGASAALVLLFDRLFVRGRWLSGSIWRSGLVVGILFAAEFIFVAEGLRWTSASHMAVFLYTAPMFAAIGLHIWLPDERLSRLQWMGIGLAFVGIVVTFLGPAGTGGNSASTDWLLGDLLGLCAGAAWGFTTVIVRTSRLSEAPPTQTLFYQLTGGFVIMTSFALLTDQFRFNSTPLAWGAMGFHVLIVSFASYLIWFWMLRRYLAARLGVLSFMTPLFGVIMGVALLNEKLEPTFLAGAALVLAGLLVVNGENTLRQFLLKRRRH